MAMESTPIVSSASLLCLHEWAKTQEEAELNLTHICKLSKHEGTPHQCMCRQKTGPTLGTA